MKKKVTMKSIAKHFNVSVSTVSKALNDSYEISSVTKKKIQNYSKEIRYKPNIFAVNLKNKTSKTIGVIIPDILNYYFARVIRGIEKICNEKGYTIVTCISNESYDKEVQILKMLSNMSIDGFIACLSKETLKVKNFSHFNDLIDNDIPIVIFNRVHKYINCDKIVTNNTKSAFKATQFLIQSQCQHIAIVSTSRDLYINKYRINGYLKALKKHDIQINETLMLLQKTEKGLLSKLNMMLENNTIDGIFTVDEISGAIVTQVLNKRQLKIPDDVSVIGFTNGILSRYSSPPLTSVNRFAHTTGEHAAKRLINKIEEIIDFNDINTEIIKTELVIRSSTKNTFVKF